MSKNAGVTAFQLANAAHRICSREMDLEESNEDRIELKSSSEEIQNLGVMTLAERKIGRARGDDLSREDSRVLEVSSDGLKRRRRRAALF